MASIGPAPLYVPPELPVGSGAIRDPELDRVRALARVLDTYFVDPLIGLVFPGGGDVLGSLLGIYTVMIAVRRKVSPVIIARMLMNLAGDTAIGIVPLFGDLFDIGFKAHRRNVALLEQRVVAGGGASWRDWLIVVGAALVFVTVMVLVVYGIVALARAIA